MVRRSLLAWVVAVGACGRNAPGLDLFPVVFTLQSGGALPARLDVCCLSGLHFFVVFLFLRLVGFLPQAEVDYRESLQRSVRFARNHVGEARHAERLRIVLALLRVEHPTRAAPEQGEQDQNKDGGPAFHRALNVVVGWILERIVTPGMERLHSTLVWY